MTFEDDTKSPARRQVLPRNESLNKYYRRQTNEQTKKQTDEKKDISHITVA